MDEFRLDEGEIEDHAAENSFERGVDYHESKSVLSVVDRGGDIRARVTAGSRAEPYTIKLSAGEERQEEISCSCPDDRDGWCKHTVAVLLAIRGRDEELEERPRVGDEIGELAGEELQTFVEDVASSRAGIRDLLEAHWEAARALRVREGEGKQVDLEPGPFRRRVLMLLHGGAAGTGHTYRRAARTKEGVEELLQITDRLIEAGEPEAALTALEAMTDVYLEGWSRIHTLGAYPGDIVEALADRLEAGLSRVSLSDEETDHWLATLEEWREEVKGYGLAGVFLPASHAAQAGPGTGEGSDR